MQKRKSAARGILLLVALLFLSAFPPDALAWTPPTTEPTTEPTGGGGGGPGGGMVRVPGELVGGVGSYGMPAPVGSPGTVEGLVMDLTTGRRAEQIKVKVNDAVVTSDWDGFYSLSGVPEGDYRVELMLDPGQGIPAQGPVMVHVGRNGVALSLGVYSGELPLESAIPAPTLVPPPPAPALVVPAVPQPASPAQCQVSCTPPALFEAPLLNPDAPRGEPQWGPNPYYYYAPLGLYDPGDPGNSGSSGGSGGSKGSGGSGGPTIALAQAMNRWPSSIWQDVIALATMVAVLLATLGSTRRLLTGRV